MTSPPRKLGTASSPAGFGQRLTARSYIALSAAKQFEVAIAGKLRTIAPRTDLRLSKPREKGTRHGTGHLPRKSAVSSTLRRGIPPLEGAVAKAYHRARRAHRAAPILCEAA